MKILKKIIIFSSLPIIFVLKILNSFILIRWAPNDYSQRIGNLVAILEHYTCYKKIQKRRVIDLFFFEKICNHYLGSVRKKQINIVNKNLIKVLDHSNNFYCNLFNLDPKVNLIPREELSARDKFGVVNKFGPSFSFSQEENFIAEKFLKSIGFSKKDKIISLIIRDKSYLKKEFPNINLDYHDYRDSDFETYEEGINYLLSSGFKVIRMGKHMEKKLNIKNKNYFDYSQSNLKSDFLDVWLMSNCYFCISSGTGLDHIPRIFKIPTLYINFINLFSAETYHKSLTYPKILVKGDTKKGLTLTEYLDSNSNKKEDFTKKNINILDLSSNEIKDAFVEMVTMMKNNWVLDDEERRRQKSFMNSFKEYFSKSYINPHGFIHDKFFISPTFLSKNAKWLL